MKKDLYYFGTDLDSAGHFFWLVGSTGLGGTNISFTDIPFDPESLTGEYLKWNLPNGHAIYRQIDKWTIFAISGSPYDRRPGCKSVFFTLDDLSYSEMLNRIIVEPICCKIIDGIKIS